MEDWVEAELEALTAKAVLQVASDPCIEVDPWHEIQVEGLAAADPASLKGPRR